MFESCLYIFLYIFFRDNYCLGDPKESYIE